MLNVTEIEKAYNLAKSRAVTWFEANPEKDNCGFAVLIAFSPVSKTIVSDKGETKGKEIVKIRYATIWRLMVERKNGQLSFFNKVQSDPFLTPDEGWIAKERVLEWKEKNNQVRDDLNKELFNALKDHNRNYFIDLHEQICEWLAGKDGK